MQFISGDGLNVLKEQAERASSLYKWLKENWKKLLVIIVALFALIFVIGIYRRCFSDSRSVIESPTLLFYCSNLIQGNVLQEISA